MASISKSIPKSVFHAQKLVQKARIFDHQSQFRSAVKYYLQATKLMTSILKQFPAMPTHRLWAQEAQLCLNRVKQLKPQVLGSSDPDNNGSPLTSSSPSSKDDSQYAEMRERILKCRVDPDPNLSWADIIGLDEVVAQIRETIEFPLQHPEVLRNGTKPPRSILLFGPPGCGKTFLIKVLASEIGLPIFHISAADLFSKWHGESQKMIRVLYETAWEFAPSIIFIDEFDGIFGNSNTSNHPLRRGSETSQLTTQLQEELQQYLDGMHTPVVNETVTIVATNYPWRLRLAQLRRFDRRLYISPPTPNDVCRIIVRFLNKVSHSLTVTQIKWLAYELRGYTPDEILKICNAAFYESFRLSNLEPVACSAHSSTSAPSTPSVPQKLRLLDFLGLTDQFKPILRFTDVESINLKQYRKWNEDAGILPILYPKHFWEYLGAERPRNPIFLYDLLDIEGNLKLGRVLRARDAQNALSSQF